MKRSLKQNLIVLVALSLVFNGLSKTLFLPTSVQAIQSPVSGEESGNATKVVVVSASSQASEVELAVSGPRDFDCVLKSGTANTLVQDAASINLNQPANCFDLEIGQLALQIHLEVKPLVGVVKEIKLVRTAEIVKAFSWHPAAQENQPLVFAVTSAVYQSKSKVSSLVNVGGGVCQATSFLGRHLNLEQLRILRC